MSDSDISLALQIMTMIRRISCKHVRRIHAFEVVITHIYTDHKSIVFQCIFIKPVSWKLISIL